nr:hypothetical protein [uncultured Tateyamaria sp.]
MQARTTAEEATIGYPTKIGTCCYCGTRAALVLKGQTRHELACSSCGAPLHNLKMMPKRAPAARDPVHRSKPYEKSVKRQVNKPVKKKHKRKKSRWADLFEDAFDIIEDIFD